MISGQCVPAMVAQCAVEPEVAMDLFSACLEFKFQIWYCHRVPFVHLSVRPSVSYFDFSGQSAGPIRLKFGSNVPLLTGCWDCKAYSGHMTWNRSKLPT